MGGRAGDGGSANVLPPRHLGRQYTPGGLEARPSTSAATSGIRSPSPDRISAGGRTTSSVGTTRSKSPSTAPLPPLTPVGRFRGQHLSEIPSTPVSVVGSEITISSIAERSRYLGMRERTQEEMEEFLKQRRKRVVLTEGPPIRRLLQHHGLKAVLAAVRKCDGLTDAKRNNANRTAMKLHHELRVRDIWQAVCEERRKANILLEEMRKEHEQQRKNMPASHSEFDYWADRPFSAPPTRVGLAGSRREGGTLATGTSSPPRALSPKALSRATSPKTITHSDQIEAEQNEVDVDLLLDWVA